MINLIILIAMAVVAPPDLIRDYTVTYTINTQGDAEVTLSWTLQQTADSIAIFRGQSKVGTSLPGDTTSFTLVEPGYGEFQYSVCWMIGTWAMQIETDILELGRFTWDPPTGDVEGYILYIADDPAALEVPVDNFIEIPGGETNYLNLKSAMDAGILSPGIVQYAAMASYLTLDEERILSALTDPIEVEFTYSTYIIPWALPQPPENVDTGH